MNYGKINPNDIANGLGVRVTLFVSGCTHHCKGCFNSETWDFNYGTPFTEETQEHILKLLEPYYIQGLTLLGGEPMEIQNQRALLPLLKKVRRMYPEKDIWCYTGYTYEKDLLSGRLCDKSITEKMLKNIDILVDGKFVEELKNLKLRFKGSENQRIIDLRKTEESGEITLWEGETNEI